MNLVAYTRVSTDEQASSGLGLDAQRDTIRRAPYVIVGEFTDAGVSGKTPPARRVGLSAALVAVRSRQADGIIVAKLDRLSRSVRDFVDLLEASQREGWNLVILDLGVDTSSPNGRFLAHVIASVAQLERELIGQRTANALAAKRDAGWVHPLATPRLVLDQIVAFRRNGLTYQAIADGLNSGGVSPSGGGTTWRPSSVRSALIAAGEVRPGTRRQREI